MPLTIVFSTQTEMNQYMLRNDRAGAIKMREDGKWVFTRHLVRRQFWEPTVFPCPNCEFCAAHKTWDTTHYIKTKKSFTNKDACEACFAKSDSGYEAGYFE